MMYSHGPDLEFPRLPMVAGVLIVLETATRSKVVPETATRSKANSLFHDTFRWRPSAPSSGSDVL